MASSVTRELTARNAAAKGVQLEVLRFPWQQPGELVARAPWPLILASDVLYDRGNLELLPGLLPRLAGPRSESWSPIRAVRRPRTSWPVRGRAATSRRVGRPTARGWTFTD